jgi:hypothetical protein
VVGLDCDGGGGTARENLNATDGDVVYVFVVARVWDIWRVEKMKEKEKGRVKKSKGKRRGRAKIRRIR